jgi:hypothetical protein
MVKDSRLDVDEALAVPALHGHRRASSGSVEQLASWAAGMMAMRIIGSKFFEKRLTIATPLGHSSLWSMLGKGWG